MVKHRIEYQLTRVIARIACSLTLEGAHKLGDRLGDLFFYVIKIRRKVALDNLQTAFGKVKSEKQLLRILHRSFQHFGRMLMEFSRMSKIERDTILQSIPIANERLIHEHMKKKKGLLILSAHFGNWEYLAAACANLGYPLYCVFMQQKNVAVDDLIKANRTHVGLKPLKIGGGAAKGVFSALRKKAMVLIVMDQDAGKDGAFIPFFNKLAATSTGPAAIALRYNIPVICGFGIRGKDGRIRAELVDFPIVNSLKNDEAGLLEFLKQYNGMIETYVQRYPEQLFWMHRRWKTRPTDSSLKYNGNRKS